ncbi:type II toxin-antitoxin system Phd/YefM family antitoxin [Arvimicrobium flavum]|uniref:type II toxin-antitoxin system Phd/YefM family antitoxin n=1 Tax=Arvimicrobium flavum TaxID=3393320 RepID=UPI00237A1FFB|nr:type II toxin-antitoxin system prevent-host-death family antitoxin [Mesorhizobium shangrilense]
MEISVSEAKAQLTDLVRQAEAGEEVILTRDGRPVVRLVPIRSKPTREERAAVLEAVRAAGAAAKKDDWPSAARSQDFLYGDDGLPA